MPTPSIDHYNDEIGRIYACHPDLFMFSPAFCRCEGQTGLFTLWTSGRAAVEPAYLASALRFCARAARDLVFALAAKAESLESTPGRGVFVFSYFDSRNDDKGTLREEYFRGILDGNADVRCVYKLANAGGILRGLRYLRRISSLEKSYFACAEHGLVGPAMVLKALWLTLRHRVRFGALRPREEWDAALFGFLRAAHLREIRDGTVYCGYLQKLICESLFSFRPRLVLFVWENSPWERILEHVKKKISPGTVSKGFQHTGFSKKLLQHYPSRFEAGLDTYPDFVLSNGHVNRDELARNPAFASRAVVGVALRQDGLLDGGLGRLEDLLPGKPMSIAYAFSWDQSTYGPILEDLKLLPESVTVYLKFHPDFPAWLNRTDFPARFINSRASWRELGRKCSLVLANDNSLMFEAYFHGMHAAVYDGADPLGLEKRDFGSPLAHLTRADLPAILSAEVVGRINDSRRHLDETHYLERYFVRPEPADPGKVFMES